MLLVRTAGGLAALAALVLAASTSWAEAVQRMAGSQVRRAVHLGLPPAERSHSSTSGAGVYGPGTIRFDTPNASGNLGGPSTGGGGGGGG